MLQWCCNMTAAIFKDHRISSHVNKQFLSITLMMLVSLYKFPQLIHAEGATCIKAYTRDVDTELNGQLKPSLGL